MMKTRRQLSLRNLRLGRSSQLKESDEEVYGIVHKSFRKDSKISKTRYQKVEKYVNEVFCALAKYDQRFDFDLISFDDHRCDIISGDEIKLFCELKTIPTECYDTIGNLENGSVEIKIRENIQSFTDASWKDVYSKASSSDGSNYLNTRLLLDTFTTALGRAVRDVWNKHRNVGLVYRVSGNQARIYVDIPDTGFFTVTLIPAIKLKQDCIKALQSKLLVKSLGDQEDYVATIYAIAQPNRYFQDESWQISYKTLEKRIMNAEMFTCGRVCLHALRHLLQSSKSPRSGIITLNVSLLRLAVIQEFAKYPEEKDWTPAKFMKRLSGTMSSLISCLREGILINEISGINMLSNFDGKSLKVLVKDVEHAASKSREKLARLESV